MTKLVYFFSKNVSWHVKSQIASKDGFQITDDLGKYLGVPILHKRVNRDTFCYVIDRVDQ